MRVFGLFVYFVWKQNAQQALNAQLVGQEANGHIKMPKTLDRRCVRQQQISFFFSVAIYSTATNEWLCRFDFIRRFIFLFFRLWFCQIYRQNKPKIKRLEAENRRWNIYSSEDSRLPFYSDAIPFVHILHSVNLLILSLYVHFYVCLLLHSNEHCYFLSNIDGLMCIWNMSNTRYVRCCIWWELWIISTLMHLPQRHTNSRNTWNRFLST